MNNVWEEVKRFEKIYNPEINPFEPILTIFLATVDEKDRSAVEIEIRNKYYK